MGNRQAKRAPPAWQTARSPLNLYREDLREALGRSGTTLRAMRRAVNEYGAGVLDVDDGAVKVWSDLHLGDTNIISYQNRPFHDVHEMNGALWANWQLGVDPDDTLVCVGNVAPGEGLSEETWERVRAAPGRPKVLVVSNHDLTGQGLLRVEGGHRAKAVLVSPGDPPLIWTLSRHIDQHRVQTDLLEAQGGGHVDVVITHWPPTKGALHPSSRVTI